MEINNTLKNLYNYDKNLQKEGTKEKLSNKDGEYFLAMDLNKDEINKIQQEISALNDKIKAEKQKLADAEKTLNKAKTTIAKTETNITAINKKYGKQ